MSRTNVAKNEDLLYLMRSTQRNYWYVSLEKSVENLSEEQANWKTSDNGNSIREIINHVNFYLIRYLGRFKGVPATDQIESNDVSFQHVPGESWCDTKNKLTALLSEWSEKTAAADQDTLTRPVYENGKGNWREVIADIALHAAYHSGQIITIRKQNGWWDAKNGVH